jgi:orotidine-5'-phosphate decarboxylase
LNFADRLSAAVSERHSQVVLGLDPDPAALLPSAAAAAGEGGPAERAARAVASHCAAIIEAGASACVAVKFQLACFERLGAPGWNAMEESIAAARAAGLLVIADAKRGDVPHTAAAYAQAMTGSTPTPWGAVPGLGVDAVTVNPMLGRDALEPLVESARAAGAGTFVLVRTSNPGATEFQDVTHGVGESPLHERLARMVAELGRDGLGDASGLSDIGAVVAATSPMLLERFRQLMPSTVFLLPGVGAQGGEIAQLEMAFADNPASGLIAASRSLIEPAVAQDDAGATARAAEQLRDAAWSLAGS